MHRVLGEEAALDPTAIEKEVRKQMAERQVGCWREGACAWCGLAVPLCQGDGGVGVLSRFHVAGATLGQLKRHKGV